MKNSIYLGCIALFLFLIACDGDNDPEPDPHIDLAAASIKFSILKETNFTGQATITGTLLNVGEDYRSGANQQILVLAQRPLGAANLETVASKPFQNLAHGDSVVVSYTRDWNSSSSSEGEWPPDYILYYTQDPDIRLDGNPYNDDDNPDNDRLVKSGSEINELFDQSNASIVHSK